MINNMKYKESWASSEQTRRSMQANRSRDTKPEIAVRRLLHAHGLRYRVDARPLPDLRRRADIVFTRLKIAVFIDGCFWHGCPEHGTATPKSHSDYWQEKIARNRERDAETNRALVDAGWVVLRYWEHEGAQEVAEAIEATVKSTRDG
ncbi:very short patch repair endonuclease [Actinobaculum sp. oral taxon 183]|uniref:very short patch repair endonuclease n=1 Tax=Actinomycetaceae TaxID=2049 RepID=UPI002FBDBF76